MDINMPGMDGVSCTKQIKEFLSENYVIDMPFIVAHTALPQDQFNDFKAKGFDDFLTKPVFASKLERIISRIFPERAPELEAASKAYSSMKVKLSKPLVQTDIQESKSEVVITME